MKRPLLALVAALTLSCNSPASGLFVVMDVSPRFFDGTLPLPPLRRVHLEVFDSNGVSRRETDFDNLDFPLSFTINPSNPNGRYRIQLTGLSDRMPPDRLFIVRRIVQMREGQVLAVSIPVRGHCYESGVLRCMNPEMTCLREVGSCGSAALEAIPYREGLDAECERGAIRNESFGCDMLPGQ
jgi:hypothetical protein